MMTRVGSPGGGAYPRRARWGGPRCAGASRSEALASDLSGSWEDGVRRKTERRQEPARPGRSLQSPLRGRRWVLRRGTGGRGHRGLAGGDEGGAPVGLGRRAESPPPSPTRRGKQGRDPRRTLTGSRSPRPLSPGGPDQVRPGQRCQTQAQRRRRRRRADAGQGPRSFLPRSRLRSSGSAQCGCVTSGPGSTRGRRGRGWCWVIASLGQRFIAGQLSDPACDPVWPAPKAAGGSGGEESVYWRMVKASLPAFAYRRRPLG